MGNKFFFISNLSEWHFSCRKQYNEIWLSKIGKLSKKEEKSLNQFKEILKKYNFHKYLGIFFITEDDDYVWEYLKNEVTTEELDKIKEIFDNFESKFNIIWNLEQFENRANILREKITNEISYVINDIETLFGGAEKEEFNIYLLQHPYRNNYIAGGANLGRRGITLEMNELSKKDAETLNNSLSVIYHEFIHMEFGKKIRELLDKFYENNSEKSIIPYLSKKSFLEEVIVHSLFTHYGFLSNKYFYKYTEAQIKEAFQKYEKIFDSVREGLEETNPKEEMEVYFFLAITFHPMIEKYLKEKNKIDEKFIKEIIKTINKKNEPIS